FRRVSSDLDSLDADPESDTGRRRTAELLGEAVVAAPAADAVLRRFQCGRLELEGRARVVVETAHEPGLDVERDPKLFQSRSHTVEVGGAVVAQVVDHS